MDNKETLDRFLSEFNHRQQRARLFTFAMTAVGLFVVVGLIGLTTWGFASYDAEKKRLSETSQQLEVSQKKIGELETIANSNASGAELMSLRNELTNTKQIVVDKDIRISQLEDELANKSSPTPSGQLPVPQDCTKCQSTVDQQVKRIQELQDQNKALNEQLNDCPGLLKRCGKKAAGSTVVNKPVVVQ